MTACSSCTLTVTCSRTSDTSAVEFQDIGDPAGQHKEHACRKAFYLCMQRPCMSMEEQGAGAPSLAVPAAM